MSKTSLTAAAIRVYGAEPDWITGKYAKLMTEEPDWAISKAINWYYQNTTAKHIKKYVLAYLKHSKTKKSVVEKIKKVDLKTFRFDPHRTGFLGIMVTRGATLTPWFETKLEKGIEYLAGEGKEKQKQAKVNEKEQAKQPTVHDRMRDQVSNLLTDLEEQLDLFMEGIEKRTLPRDWFSMLKFLKGNGVKGKQTSMIADRWRRLSDEVNEALEKSDLQLVEGYGFLSRPQLKRLGKFLEVWITDCETHGATKRKQRKARKKKVKTPEQLVAKVQYLEKSKEFKVKSVDPKGIIGADCVIVFNVKYRFLTIYRAKNAHGLSVKGTTIQNFCPTKSKERRLRQPKAMLAVSTKMGIRAISNEFKNVRTRDRTPKGRLNKSCVILRTL
ncbi:MAG: hypothetical protein QQN46_02010 [Nitrosopumilus sp.]